MKKSIFAFGVLIAGTLLIINACKKETKPTENAVSETQEFTTFEEGEQLALKIKNFGNSLEQAKQGKTNNEAIALEEALENMELLINASHGFPFEAYGQRTSQTISFQLVPNAEGKVTMTEIAAAYDQMKAQIKEVYENANFEEKGLIVVTLKVGEEAKGESTIEADIAIGDKDKNNPFDECWYYGELLGNCAQTIFQTDGAREMGNEIAANNPIIGYNDCPSPREEYRLILENQPEIHLEGNEYFDLNGDYKIFFLPDLDGNGFTDEEMQLSTDAMNHYYSNEIDLIYNTIPEEKGYNFPNYVLVNNLLDGNPYSDGMQLNLRHEHFLIYAKRYWVKKGIIPDPTPINAN